MKLLHAATISTSLVIIFGLTIVMPTFTRSNSNTRSTRIMLSFSIVNVGNPSEWCTNLSIILEKYDLRATVFFAGDVAHERPECVSIFGSSIDVGSQTYHYVELATIPDYAAKLEEIAAGKEAVDHAGNLTSRLFRAAFKATDQDIQSLLNTTGILADFSYDEHYSLFRGGEFVEFNASTRVAPASSPEDILTLANTAELIIYEFSNTLPTDYIEHCISALIEENVRFVSASEVAGFSLTQRR